MQDYPKWNLLSYKKPKTVEEVVEILTRLRNLDLKEKSVSDYSLKDLDIDSKEFKKALLRLKKALKNKEKIFVYGDYDADGITATAIMWETLYSLGFNITPFIPDRFNDGYGINAKTVKRLIEENSDLKLIITVDNGIVASSAVTFCNKKGIDVIITDHHTKSKKLPKSLATIHTSLTSGSAISWIFSHEIEKSLTKETKFSTKNLELAAIGTVADQLPLTGFNRSLVKEGINNLKKTSRVGLKALYEVSAIDQKKLGTYEINYGLAPRINASGRLASGMDALRLLCTRDKSKAQAFAINLDKLNLERQELVHRLIEIADKKVGNNKIIVVAHEEFHEGVIGLIASRLTEKYYRPSIVLSIEGDIAKASSRSIKGFSIVNLIDEFRSEIIEGGGHEMAGGFVIETKNIKNFEKKILAHYNSLLTEDLLTKSLDVELSLSEELLQFSLLNQLEKLEPFGNANKKPLFIVEAVSLKNIKAIGKELDHLKFSLSKIDCMFFRKGNLVNNLVRDEVYDLVFSLEKNVWNGRESLQLVVKDIRKSDGKGISKPSRKSKKI